MRQILVLFLFSMVFLSIQAASAQTLKIAHKSHSGSYETFEVKLSHNNFGLPASVDEKEAQRKMEEEAKRKQIEEAKRQAFVKDSIRQAQKDSLEKAKQTPKEEKLSKKQKKELRKQQKEKSKIKEKAKASIVTTPEKRPSYLISGAIGLALISFAGFLYNEFS